MQPDWQDASTYEYTENLDSIGWAWEFLRRNPEYKADWAEFLKKKSELEKVYGKSASWKPKALDAEPMAWHYDPPKKPGESDAVWRMKCIAEGGNPDRTSIIKGPAKKWGLRQLCDPDLAAKGKPEFVPRTEVRIWPHVSDVEGPVDFDSREDGGEKGPIHSDGEVEAPITYAERSDFVYIEVNLRKNISEQLNQAESQLTGLRKHLIQSGVLKAPELTKAHFEKFRDYLRILDAYASIPKPKVKDMAKVLFSDKTNEPGAYDGNKAVYETHKQARQLRDGKFRLLL